LGLLNRCFGMPELNSRDALGCRGGSDQALQTDALGISSVSRPKRNEVDSLRVDMGNPGLDTVSSFVLRIYAPRVTLSISRVLPTRTAIETSVLP